MSGSGIWVKINVINSLQILLPTGYLGSLPFNSHLKDTLSSPIGDPGSGILFSRKAENIP